MKIDYFGEEVEAGWGIYEGTEVLYIVRELTNDSDHISVLVGGCWDSVPKRLLFEGSATVQ